MTERKRVTIHNAEETAEAIRARMHAMESMMQRMQSQDEWPDSDAEHEETM